MKLYFLLAKKSSLSGRSCLRQSPEDDPEVAHRPAPLVGFAVANVLVRPGRQACESRASVLTTEGEFGSISVVDIVQRKKQDLYLFVKDTGLV